MHSTAGSKVADDFRGNRLACRDDVSQNPIHGSQTEIEELHDAIRRYFDFRRFQVPMKSPCRARIPAIEVLLPQAGTSKVINRKFDPGSAATPR
jgi:hypothetical protein